MGCTVSTVNVLWVGKSVLQPCFGSDSQYSDCVVVWTVIITLLLCAGQKYGKRVVGWIVSTVTVLWVGKSVQRLCCRFDIHYSNVAVG